MPDRRVEGPLDAPRTRGRHRRAVAAGPGRAAARRRDRHRRHRGRQEVAHGVAHDAVGGHPGAQLQPLVVAAPAGVLDAASHRLRRQGGLAATVERDAHLAGCTLDRIADDEVDRVQRDALVEVAWSLAARGVAVQAAQVAVGGEEERARAWDAAADWPGCRRRTRGGFLRSTARPLRRTGRRRRRGSDRARGEGR